MGCGGSAAFFQRAVFRLAEILYRLRLVSEAFYGAEKMAGKRMNLEFDGAFQVAEVFVNGRQIGEHEGGYTGFTFDITDGVKAGDNVVAVRVNNLWNARIAPRAGEHTFSGGIYRNVRLVVTAPLHVAWFGTFVSTRRCPGNPER